MGSKLNDSQQAQSDPQNTKQADQLIAEALENPEVSPALKAVLSPIVWYLQRLQHEIDLLTAPVRWIESLRDKAQAQTADRKAWEDFRREAKIRPRIKDKIRRWGGSQQHGSVIWVTPAQKPWQAYNGWSRVADAQDGPMGENHMTLWANPSLRAVAIEHEDGRAFIEHLPSTARFTEKMQSFQEITRNHAKDQEAER